MHNTVFQKLLLYPLFLPVIAMPGRSHHGPIPMLSSSQMSLKARLEKVVNVLAVDIGERSISRYSGMQKAMTYIENALSETGYTVDAQTIVFDNKTMSNYVVEKRGSVKPDDIIIIGAHYDTVPGSPGADDNATGVAAVLELARVFRDLDLHKTVRFVAFANEEHPGATAETMGSYAYARRCRERNENIVAVLSLEMLGYFSNDAGSQKYPAPLNLYYPTTGNFVAFVGNADSRRLVRKAVGSFRKLARIPSEGAAAPDSFKDASRSDHGSFWQFGYPGLMVTDTSNFRYQFYHGAEDTPDKLDFASFALVVDGLVQVVKTLAD